MGNIVSVFMPSPTMLWVAVLMLMWHSRLSMPCKPAERYDCEERYVMVKVTVDFQYVINYTSQKFFDSWASKNCMLRIKTLFFIQRGTIFAVYIRGVGESVFCFRYVAAVKEFPLSISD